MAPSAVETTNGFIKEGEVKPKPTNQSIGTTRKIICFSDFDGTIVKQDTGHILVSAYGCGDDRRKELDKDISSKKRSFRDVSDEMWATLNVPFEEGLEKLQQDLELDPGFTDFLEFCANNKIPFNVISAGLKPILEKVLLHFIGEEQSGTIEIMANDATIDEAGTKWEPKWVHDTPLGHDKAVTLNDYKEQAKRESDDGTVPMIVFIGDGVSDLPAAKEADVLFARRDLALMEHCIAQRIPFFPFDSFADIQRDLISIAKLDEKRTGGKDVPTNFNPRANLWRRASSKSALPIFVRHTPAAEKSGFDWTTKPSLNRGPSALGTVGEA